MLFRRITSEGLAHHSYVVADGREAAIVDPRRDVDVYLDLLRDEGLSLRAIFETHRNEDYLSGAAELAGLTGATVLHGPRLAWNYGSIARDGDTLELGRLRIRVLETPGHTDESLSFALVDTRSSSAPVLVFTGDALFVGDVGRTDLYGPSEALRLAETLYGSIVDRLLPLGDGVAIFPAHGGGSVCGGRISDRDVSTLGYERLADPMLRERDRAAFVARKVGERWVRPPYFTRMEAFNREGNAPSAVRVPAIRPLTPGELDERMRAGVVLVDARMPQAFAGAHVPRSLNVWRDGLAAYLPWAALPDQEIALVLPEGASLDAVARTLARIGYDRVAGYLRGGFESWQNEGRPIARTETITTDALRAELARGKGELVVVDVREPDEQERGSIDGARRIFVGDLEARAGELPKRATIVTMCSVGHRGTLAASVLERMGLRAVSYLGGFDAWSRTTTQEAA